MSSELFVCVAVEVNIAAARAWLQTIALYKGVLWWFWWGCRLLPVATEVQWLCSCCAAIQHVPSAVEFAPQ